LYVAGSVFWVICAWRAVSEVFFHQLVFLTSAWNLSGVHWPATAPLSIFISSGWDLKNE
jgi:hypothetical protein